MPRFSRSEPTTPARGAKPRRFERQSAPAPRLANRSAPRPAPRKTPPNGRAGGHRG